MPELVFPFGGLNKQRGFQDQPPFTSHDLRNVWPRDAIVGRRRGGSRSGLMRAFYDPENNLPEGAVRMLNSVAYSELASGSVNWAYVEDGFNSEEFGAHWSLPAWGDPVVEPVPLRDNYAASETVGTPAALIYEDTDYAYTGTDVLVVETLVVPFEGAHIGTYRLYAQMTNAGALDGVIGALVLTGSSGAYSGYVTHYASGTPTTHNFTGGTIGSADAGWFTMRLQRSGGNTLATCFWSGREVFASASIGATRSGTRFGFSVMPDVPGTAMVDAFRAQYRPATHTTKTRRIVIMSQKGGLWVERRIGELEKQALNAATLDCASLSSTEQLMSAERAGVLYIADRGPVLASGTDGTTDGSPNAIFDTAGGTNFTAAGVAAGTHVVQITAGSGATLGQYVVNTVAPGSDNTRLELWGSPGSGLSGLTYRITRNPKKVTISSTSGQVRLMNHAQNTSTFVIPPNTPIGCRLIALYLDCLVWSGDPEVPGAWYMSRQGSPDDHDITKTDAQAAASYITTQAGIIAEPIVALVTSGDDYLLFGCRSSLWVLNGHPRQGGQLLVRDRRIGIVSQSAWCYGPRMEIFLLSHDGLYVLPPMAGGPPQQLSHAALPRDLIEVDSALFTVSMGYDHRHRGVHIHLVPGGSTAGKHWFFDAEDGGFFPMELQEATQPMMVHDYQSDSVIASSLLLGGRDGHIRRFHHEATSDDGSLFDSRALYGPLMLGGGRHRYGLVTALRAVVGQHSGPVDWQLRTGDTPEEAAVAPLRANGTWAAGRNPEENPRQGGNAAYLRLSSSIARPWVIESIEYDRVDYGHQRVRGR